MWRRRNRVWDEADVVVIKAGMSRDVERSNRKPILKGIALYRRQHHFEIFRQAVGEHAVPHNDVASRRPQICLRQGWDSFAFEIKTQSGLAGTVDAESFLLKRRNS